MVSRSDTTALKAKESRRKPRRRVLKHVQVLSLDRKATSAIDCTLRNISRSGAQLFGSEASISRIPSQFYLVAPGQLRMIHCRVVWKTFDAVGIAFLTDPGPLSPAPDGSGDSAAFESEAPPESYVLDRTTGAVVKLNGPDSCKAPDRDFPDLERMLCEAVGLKVEILGDGTGSRVVLHVETLQQLNDLCRQLAQGRRIGRD
jgi:hypothetical protein